MRRAVMVAALMALPFALLALATAALVRAAAFAMVAVQ